MQFTADDEDLSPEVPPEFDLDYYCDLLALNRPREISCFISHRIIGHAGEGVEKIKRFEDLTLGEKWHLYHCSDLIHPSAPRGERNEPVLAQSSELSPLKGDLPDASTGPLPLLGGHPQEGRNSGNPVHIARILPSVLRKAEWAFYFNNVIKPGVCHV